MLTAQLIGFVGRMPESRFTQQGQEVVNFTVAHSWKKGQEDQTTWVRVTVFGKSAEYAKRAALTGAMVYVQGRQRIEQYQKSDGTTGLAVEITANDLQVVRPPKNQDGFTPIPDQAEPPVNPIPRQRQAAPAEDLEALPF